MRGRTSRSFVGFVVESGCPLELILAIPAETLLVQPETVLSSMLVSSTEYPLEEMILECSRKILAPRVFSFVKDPIS